MREETLQRRLEVENEFELLVWRFEQLRSAGYEESLAGELAARTDIDLGLARDLLAGGCPVDLALRILC